MFISEGTDVTTVDDEDDDDDDDSFIVERIIDKQFHCQRNRYEYLVRWVGYTDQTWELPGNIPDKLIKAYENSTVAVRESIDTQYSFWPFRKLTEKLTT